MYHDDQPNIFVRLWHFITFKTYGNNLLTTSSASYLTGLSVIMLVVALTEAFAWGHFGTNFTPENPLIGRLAVGSIAFCALWYFDRMMVTQDLLTKEHAHTLEGEEKPNSIFGKWKIGSYFIFIIRLAIIIASVYVTSGFITQLVFKTDIEKEIQTQYKNNIETTKQNILGKFDTKIHEQENYLKSLHDKLQKEIGGRRGSGYGKGAVAKSIEQEINDFSITLNETKTKKQNTEEAINQAILSNDEQLLKTFGIEVVKDSPIFRQQAVDKFSQDPAFKEIRFTVEVGLFLLSLMLVLSKIFQTRNVQLYYSEKLQELWNNYTEGHYDKYLSDRQKSTNLSKRAMPQTFERIMIDYAKNKDRYEREEQEQKRRELELHNQELQAQQKQKEQAERLEQSHQEWAERQARELQGLEYESKRKHHIQKQIDDNKTTIKNQMTLFLQENSEKINELKTNRERILTEIADNTRIYQSYQEDIEARQKRLANAENKLIELKKFVQELEQKDRTTEGAVKTYAFAQDAIEEQKATIKNIQDNWLSFERDMNFYIQKIKNLNEEKSEIEKELLPLKQTYITLKEAYHRQELAEIELLGTINLTTPYIHGTEAEIPHLAEKIKNNESHYFYIEGSHTEKNKELNYKE